MFIVVFTVDGRKEPIISLVDDQDDAIGLFKEYSPRGADAKDALVETRSPLGTPGFVRFCEVDLISVEMYEELDPKEEERRAHEALVSTVESHRRLSRTS